LFQDEKIEPRKILIGDEWMALLRQSELLLLLKGGATVNNVLFIPVDHKGKIFFEINLLISTREGEEKYLLITGKNEPQRWSSLNKATKTIGELIPELEEVRVKLRKT